MHRFVDPIHGFIHLKPIERDIVNSLPFQRLAYIRQLGMTYLVFPGATHSRLEHSLGTMFLASSIYDQVTQEIDFLKDPVVREYWKQVVRIAAIYHDVGHLPFSHVVEDLYLDKGHEEMTYRFLRSSYFSSILEGFELPDSSYDPIEDVCRLAVGPKVLKELDPEITFTPWQKVLSLMITGDDFGADRMDYLMRDAYYTGVSYGAIDVKQIIESLRLFKLEDGSLTLGVEEKALQAIESLLLARHFMHARIYQNPKTKAFSFHLRNFFKARFPNITKDPLEGYLYLQDQYFLNKIWKSCRQPEEPGYDDAQCLLRQKERFRYHKLTYSENLHEKLETLQEAFPNKVGYENKILNKEGFDENLMVVKTSTHEIVEAKKLSEIYKFVKAEQHSCFIFVEVEKEQEVLKLANSLQLL
jgi:uncharacterized protein